MNESSDNLSIQLQQNFAGKSNQQILEQFQQITRRIAQSDRNNIIYREMKKQKDNEFNQLNKKKNILESENHDLDSEYKKITNNLQEAKSMIKKNEEYFETVTRAYEAKYHEERQIETKTLALVKQNQKLEKKYASLQAEYDEILKTNKQKSTKIQHLNKQKQQKNKLLQKNEQRIQQLQKSCQKTKNQAQKIQNQVKKQRQIFIELKKILQQKQSQLNQRQLQHEDFIKKQQQTKKSISKMMSTAKSIEEEIDKKMAEMKNLQKIHVQYQTQVLALEESQKKLEDLLMKRREVIANMKKCNGKIVKEKEANKQLVGENNNGSYQE